MRESRNPYVIVIARYARSFNSGLLRRALLAMTKEWIASGIPRNDRVKKE